MVQWRALPQDERRRSYEYLGLTMFPSESSLYGEQWRRAPHARSSSKRNEASSPERRNTYNRSRLGQFCSLDIWPELAGIRGRTSGAQDRPSFGCQHHLADEYIDERVAPLRQDIVPRA